MSKNQLGYVYLFINEFNYVKVGHATNPQNRAKAIESSSGVTVLESHVSPLCSNYLEIERALKQQFADFRKKGEWFDIEFDTAKTALDSYFSEVNTPAIEPLIAIVNHSISDNQEEPTVNARELHAFLGTKIHFKDWIKKRIADYDFVEGTDYVKFELSADLKMTESGVDLSEILAAQKNAALETTGCGSFGQQGRIEYTITLDMAKELSMVERTPKGKEARQYFIACEKALKQGKLVNNDMYNLIYTTVRRAVEEVLHPQKIQPVQQNQQTIDESIAAWFNACVILNPDAKTNVGNAEKNPDGTYKNANKWLFPNYCDFCERENLEPVSLRRFSGLLVSYCQQEGFNVKRPHREREGTKIKGIHLRHFN